MNSGLFFARMSLDKDMWVPLIEKAFAKVFGNYEYLSYGLQAEALKMLTGAPTKTYLMSDIGDDPDNVAALITNAL